MIAPAESSIFTGGASSAPFSLTAESVTVLFEAAVFRSLMLVKKPFAISASWAE
jgi:hypothetical protein